MSFKLRTRRSHLNYYEPEEHSFDEYVYCERCADFVYDYCALHGPLLIIPDNKIPEKTKNSSNIPRAALTIPHVFLHLAPSIIPGAGLGVFSTLTLPRGVRFGPYRGQRRQNADSMYCWQIYDGKNKPSHVLDAADCHRSNWMRYVNCARHWKEQNLLAYQYRGQLYYRTIKIIPRHTELLVFYGGEFANALHINLSKYNSANYYKEIISNSSKSLRDDKEVDMGEEYLTADQFHFIDENIDKGDSNKHSTNISKKTEIQSNKIGANSSKEIVLSDSEIKQDCKKNKPKTRYECNTCYKTFADTRNLKVHALNHSNTWKFSCEYCSYKSNLSYSFKQHLGKHTNTFQFSCKSCPFKTNYKRNYKNHCLTHEKTEKVSEKNGPNVKVNCIPKTCDLCDFKTYSRKVFTTHMSRHKGNINKCDIIITQDFLTSAQILRK